MFRIKCLGCGKILESKYTHDFQQCSCENETFADGGGKYYSRYGGRNMDLIEILEEEQVKST